MEDLQDISGIYFQSIGFLDPGYDPGYDDPGIPMEFLYDKIGICMGKCHFEVDVFSEHGDFP